MQQLNMENKQFNMWVITAFDPEINYYVCIPSSLHWPFYGFILHRSIKQYLAVSYDIPGCITWE